METPLAKQVRETILDGIEEYYVLGKKLTYLEGSFTAKDLRRIADGMDTLAHMEAAMKPPKK